MKHCLYIVHFLLRVQTTSACHTWFSLCPQHHRDIAGNWLPQVHFTAWTSGFFEIYLRQLAVTKASWKFIGTFGWNQQVWFLKFVAFLNPAPPCLTHWDSATGSHCSAFILPVNSAYLTPRRALLLPYPCKAKTGYFSNSVLWQYLS